MESLICKRLSASGLQNIFYQKSPDDVRLEKNYPQTVLGVDKFSDAIHGVNGLLTVEIICTRESSPEPLEKKIRNALQGVFFKAEEVFTLKWQKTELFEEPASERTPLLIGMILTFNIYELPTFKTEEPDLIDGLEDWAKNFGATIINASDFEIFEPTEKCPALWLSLQNVKLIRQMAAVIFLEGKVKVHVFAPLLTTRRKWLTSLQRELIFSKAIKLRDGSPARLQSSELSFEADEIEGQLSATFEYGLGRRFFYSHKINPKLGVRD